MDVPLDRRHHAEVIEIGRPQGEDHAVQFFHGPGKQIGDLVQFAGIGDRVSITVVPGTFDQSEPDRACLVQGAGDERRHRIMNIARDPPPLVLLQPDRAPVQLTHLLGVLGDRLPRQFQIMDLTLELVSHLPESHPEIGDLTSPVGRHPLAEIATRDRHGVVRKLTNRPGDPFTQGQSQHQRCRNGQRQRDQAPH